MPSNSACFNSQPPEGGWYSDDGAPIEVVAFQLTAARRRLGDRNRAASQVQVFQLTAARRRLVPPLKPLTRKACIALFR